MAKKNHTMDPVGEVLDQSLKRLDLGAKLKSYGIWPVWNDVVGETVARNAQPEKIRNGVLFVKVSSPVWMQQLQFMKTLVVEKLNERLQAELVKNIFFVVGTVSFSPPNADPKDQAAEAGIDTRVAVDDRFLETVEDPQIRRAFQKLLRSYARRGKKP